MSVIAEYMREWRKVNPLTQAQKEANREKCQRWRDAKLGIKPADEQMSLPVVNPAARPADGPRCACGRTLYAYEHGKCLRCARNSIIAAREGKVMVTDAAQRNRVKRQPAAQAGD